MTYVIKFVRFWIVAACFPFASINLVISSVCGCAEKQSRIAITGKQPQTGILLYRLMSPRDFWPSFTLSKIIHFKHPLYNDLKSSHNIALNPNLLTFSLAYKECDYMGNKSKYDRHKADLFCESQPAWNQNMPNHAEHLCYPYFSKV